MNTGRLVPNLIFGRKLQIILTKDRWCSNCNRMYPLDKEGHKKCPEWKVGMPYEPGYYERKDFDPQRQF
jgi:hypothetical protein